MIPLPPPDPALAGLDVALDGDAIREVIAEQLELEILSCRPSYVRYKRGTSCVVQYDLELAGAARGTPAHVRLARGTRAEQVWARPSFERLVERAARRHSPPRARRAAYVPALGAIVQLFPVDFKLPALVRATSARKMRRALALPEKPEVDVMRYKPARKALVRYRVGEDERRSLYAKLYADGHGERRFATASELFAAEVPVAEPLAYFSDFRMLVHAAADGTRLADVRDDPGFRDSLGAVAGALARLHATPVGRLAAPGAEAEARAVVAAGRAIGTLVPDLAEEADRVARAIVRHLRALDGADATIHGDFYDDQVLVSDAGVVLLDLDEARRGHPLADVGNLMAHLSARGDPGGARLEFLHAYARYRPDAPGEVVPFEAAGLLKLAVGPFRRLEPDWPAAVERLLGLAADRLDEDRPRHAAARADPALPQLETLRDPVRMARELGSVCGRPASLDGVTIVRHKHGRRCTLRYDVKRGNGRERLFAKTYASDRAPRVFASLQALSAGHSCGARVAFPEPVACVPELNLVLQKEVPGRPIARRLLAGDEPLAAGVAEALHALHTSRVELARTHSLARELAPLGERVATIGGRAPSLEPLARRCLAVVHADSERAWPWRSRPVHRDFYHDQVLASDRDLSFLDLDDAAMSEPAVDVANFLAHLALLGLEERGFPDALAGPAAAFRDRYRDLDGDLDLDLLDFLQGATLLRLAAIHVSRPRGDRLAERLLRESEQALATV